MDPSDTTVQPPPSSSEAQTIIQDLFELGVGAAALYVKNPATLARAASIIEILQGVFPKLVL